MAAPSRPRTILVVEDDAALRRFYRHVLSIKGHTVVAVEDGIDALRHIDAVNESPDMIILDLDLPRLAGRDVKHELRAHTQTVNVPILVITGTEAKTLNPDDFSCVIRKPVTAEELIEAVDRCLRLRREADESDIR